MINLKIYILKNRALAEVKNIKYCRINGIKYNLNEFQKSSELIKCANMMN
jgi:hypothetical protein